ncbi:MAG: protoporphyrinogen oxidase [Gemmatimonadota bacterium]
MRVAVVGGGLSGLAAARALGRSGHEIVLLEGKDRLGGVIRTVRKDGFLIETGPESFVTRKPALLDLCRALGLEDELLFADRSRPTGVFARGRLRPLPAGVGIAPTSLRPVLGSGILTPLEKLRLLTDLFLPARAAAGDESLGSVVRRRLGEAALDRLVAPIAAGIYGADPDRLSLAATFPEILKAARRGSLIRNLRPAEPGGGSPPSPLATLRDGLGRLVERWVEDSEGVDVRTGARVARMDRIEVGWRLELAGGAVLEADAAILAIPAAEAARLLAADLPGAARLLQAFRRVTTAVVTLGYEAGDVPVPGSNGFVVARDERLPITAVTFSSSKWPGRAPPGRVLVRVYLGREDDPIDSGADDGELVRRALAGLGIVTGWRADPILARVDRWVDAMPQYDVGHLDRVAAVEGELGAAPRVLLAGADYRGIGLADCVAQGEIAARRAQCPGSRAAPHGLIG